MKFSLRKNSSLGYPQLENGNRRYFSAINEFIFLIF